VEVKNPALGKFGYFRIYSFDVDDADYFVNEFIDDIKPKLQENTKGLIIDVRGNGGGLITAGERLLQVITDKEVIPEKFAFRKSPLMLKLCRENSDGSSGLNLGKWVSSMVIPTGEKHSQGFPIVPDSTEIREITPDDKYNGNVVLITDALCYSTTDIFAAGFQDNKIGKILGIHKNTGAGGANAWAHDLLGRFLNDDELMPPLPEGCEFTVAIRRSTRVGEKDDIPLEELGVEPDCIHQMTKDDLLKRNQDLIKHAVRVLEGLVECKDANILQ
jgi:C-terminal processing protease CtpA/Prc